MDESLARESFPEAAPAAIVAKGDMPGSLPLEGYLGQVERVKQDLERLGECYDAYDPAPFEDSIAITLQAFAAAIDGLAASYRWDRSGRSPERAVAEVLGAYAYALGQIAERFPAPQSDPCGFRDQVEAPLHALFCEFVRKIQLDTREAQRLADDRDEVPEALEQRRFERKAEAYRGIVSAIETSLRGAGMEECGAAYEEALPSCSS